MSSQKKSLVILDAMKLFQNLKIFFAQKIFGLRKKKKVCMKKEIVDRIKGAMYGLVVGDCLGACIEFTAKDSHPFITDYQSGGPHCLRAGDWTDDTAMALAVLDSIGQNGKVDTTDIMAKFALWMSLGKYSSNGRCFDIGFGTAQAIRDFVCGNGVVKRPDSMGNGSIMRLAPSVIYCAITGNTKCVFDVSRLTHWNNEVDSVVQKMAFDIMIPQINTGVKTLSRSIYKTRNQCSNSGRATDTFNAALWAFQTTGTFEDGMIKAVNLGGDSDTIGAVYGQIAGSYYGYSNIPERWLNGIIDKIFIDKLITNMMNVLGVEIEND